jgi:hypothetical protein
MALNLWTTNGKPSSYNPLPSPTWPTIPIDCNKYTITLRAKSPRGNNATLTITDDGSNDVNKTWNLTTEFQTFTATFTSTSKQVLWIQDWPNNTGDVVIDSISLTQAPLAKNTINGVDGFNSGKWTNYNIAGGVQVIDEQTVQFTSTGIWQDYYIVLPVQPNTTYTLSFGNTVGTVYSRQSNSNTVVGANMGSTVAFPDTVNPTSITFTTNSTSTYLQIGLSSGTAGVGTFTFSKPILNLGSIPAPYEPKRGDNMVLPTVKKNLIHSSMQGTNWGTTVTRISDNEYQVVTQGVHSDEGITFNLPQYLGQNLVYSVDVMGVSLPSNSLNIKTNEASVATFGTPLSISPSNNYSRYSYLFVNKTTYANNTNSLQCIISTTNPLACTFYVRFPQLEQGTTATPFAPYAVQVNPKPKRAIASAQRGLAFNGGYITVPLQSPQTFSYVFDFSLPSNYTSEQLIYSRDFGQSNGITTVYNKVSIVNGKIRFTVATNSGTFDVNSNGIFNDGLRHHVVCSYDGFITKIFVDGVLDISSNSISGSVSYSSLNTIGYIGNDSTGGNFRLFMGTLFNFKLLDGNGVLIFNYDFTNPRTVTGNTVLNSGNMNLLPSFDSGQWTIHANAKVLGKDVLHLDATGTFQTSSVLLDVIPNKNYVYYCNTNGTVRIYNGTTTSDSLLTASTGVSFTPTVGKILINIHNGSTTSGSFDFIRPQLYQLDGTEGTINGSPVLLKKSSARKLFAKR